jgi:hypothetical protein
MVHAVTDTDSLNVHAEEQCLECGMRSSVSVWPCLQPRVYAKLYGGDPVSRPFTFSCLYVLCLIKVSAVETAAQDRDLGIIKFYILEGESQVHSTVSFFCREQSRSGSEFQDRLARLSE